MSAAVNLRDNYVPPAPKFVVRFTHTHLSLSSLTEVIEGFMREPVHHRQCEDKEGTPRTFELGLTDMKSWDTMAAIICGLTKEMPLMRVVYKPEPDEELLKLSVYAKH